MLFAHVEIGQLVEKEDPNRSLGYDWFLECIRELIFQWRLYRDGALFHFNYLFILGVCHCTSMRSFCLDNVVFWFHSDMSIAFVLNEVYFVLLALSRIVLWAGTLYYVWLMIWHYACCTFNYLWFEFCKRCSQDYQNSFPVVFYISKKTILWFFI